ncbi:unnamed protein product [Somion occarium]
MTITQSALFGGNQGDVFNDINVAGWPATQNIRKISKIVVRHGEIVDNIAVTYERTGGLGPDTQSHGGAGGTRVNTINLSESEFLVGVCGQCGPVVADYGPTSIQKLQFMIVDKARGAFRVEGPFANEARTGGTPFCVVGTIMALAGRTMVVTSQDQGTQRFMQSLSFFTPSNGFD